MGGIKMSRVYYYHEYEELERFLNMSPEEREKEGRRLEEESKKLKDWPPVE